MRLLSSVYDSYRILFSFFIVQKHIFRMKRRAVICRGNNFGYLWDSQRQVRNRNP